MNYIGIEASLNDSILIKYTIVIINTLILNDILWIGFVVHTFLSTFSSLQNHRMNLMNCNSCLFQRVSINWHYNRNHTTYNTSMDVKSLKLECMVETELRLILLSNVISVIPNSIYEHLQISKVSCIRYWPNTRNLIITNISVCK